MEISNAFRFYYDAQVFKSNGDLNTELIDTMEEESYISGEWSHEPDWVEAMDFTLRDNIWGIMAEPEEVEKIDFFNNGIESELALSPRWLGGTSRFEVTNFTPWARSYLPDAFRGFEIEPIDFGSTLDTSRGFHVIQHFIGTSFVSCELINIIKQTNE